MSRKRPTIMAHCLVQNEEKWVWFAINSVLDYVDEVLVYDTGSTDRTVEIVKSIKSEKITLEKKGKVDPHGFTKLRQEMLDRTNTDWFLILDGDDVWPKTTIRELRMRVDRASVKRKAVIVGYWNCVGDVFHYSSKVANIKYPIAPSGVTGWMSTRAIRRDVEGLHCIGIHGNQAYVDGKGRDRTAWRKDSIIFLKGRYFHMSYLPRSSSRKRDKEVSFRGLKTHFKLDDPFPDDIEYPEVFYRRRPEIVPNPWRRFTFFDWLRGLFYRTENFVVWRIKGREVKGLAH